VLFPSITFLFYFLPLFALLYCLAPGITAKNIVLLAASLLFYAWGEPRFVALLAFQIVLNYGFALLIGASAEQRRRIAPAGVAANLALLGIFKYADFAVGSFNAGVRREYVCAAGHRAAARHLVLHLPRDLVSGRRPIAAG
jgi:D-alanyl-lipoteichoic acid acyltransferase DltB (MBOAT superfamily)